MVLLDSYLIVRVCASVDVAQVLIWWTNMHFTHRVAHRKVLQ